ncbi:MAG: hypothetical protein WB424_15435 [Terracidiphilus sp.]|jgi:hypothetical protein
MGKNDDSAEDKAYQILRQMREDTGSKMHLDQIKHRAQKALSKAVEARNEDAFTQALSALGIDPESETGKAHLHGFRRLPPKRY